MFLMFRKLALLCILASLAACVSTNPNGGEDRMSREYLERNLPAGKATKEDVTRLFGQPRYKSESSDRRDYWSYSESQINGNVFTKAMEFMPNLGTIGNAAVDSQKPKTDRDLSIHFNPNGTVRSYSVSGSTGAGC